MGPLVLLHVALAGFFSCAALYSAWVWWWSREERTLLLFSVQCLLCGALSVALFHLATAQSVSEATTALAWRLAFGGLDVAATAFVVSRLTGVRARGFCWTILAAASAGAVYAIAFGFAEPRFVLTQVTMPWGETLSTPLWHTPSPTLIVAYLGVGAVNVFAMVGAIRLFATDRLGGGLIGFAATAGLAALIGAFLADRGDIVLPYIGNIPYASWVVLIAVQLSRENARLRRRQASGEQRLRGIFDHTSHFMGLLDADGIVLEVNRSVLDAAGIAADAALGTPFWDTPLWAHSAELRERVRRATVAAAAGQTVSLESWHPAPDGSIRHVEFSIKPVRDERGRIVLLIPDGRDVTARKKTQKSLDRLVEVITPRTGQDFFQSMVNTICEICEADFALAASIDPGDPACLRTIAVSHAGRAADNFSYPKHGTPCEAALDGGFCYYPDRAQALFPTDQLLVDLGIHAYMAMPMSSADGSRPGLLALMHRGALRQPEQAKALLQVVVARAAAELERRRADAALIESESRFRSLFQGLDAGVVLQDGQDHILVSNPAAAQMLGSTNDQLHGGSWRDPEWQMVREDGTPMPFDEVPSVVATRTLQPVRNAIVGAGHLQSHQRTWLQVTATPQLGPDGSLLHVLVTLVDVTTRKRAEDALRASSRRLSLAITATSDAVWEWNYQTGETYYSPRWFEMLGVSADLPMTLETFTSLCHPDDVQPTMTAIAAAIQRRSAWAQEFRMRRGDGGWAWVLGRGSVVEWDATGAALVIAMVNSDITARREADARRRELEAQLAQSQRMESMGRLAGGIAHDFNNLLTVINGYSDLLLHTARLDAPATEMIEDIRSAGDRAATLTRQLLTFSRHQVVDPHILELNGVVADTQRMLQRLIGAHVTLVTRLCDQQLWLMADTGQLGQVVVNLAVNARDAMPDGGTLTIATAFARIDASTAESLSPQAHAGDYAALTVTDTGMGMPNDVRARIFEPFFTTKGAGKGTGLGLTTVHGIIRQSGGFITVDSVPGAGSTFTVYLPTTHQEAGVTAEPVERPAQVQAGRTVLMVEDEAPVRAVVHTMLQRLGFVVIVAAHAEEALRQSDACPGTIDLLLTDVIMPGLNGRQLAELLLQRRPGLRVLYMSGYTDDGLVQQLVQSADAAYLQKPFDFEALARKVRQAPAPSPPASTM